MDISVIIPTNAQVRPTINDVTRCDSCQCWYVSVCQYFEKDIIINEVCGVQIYNDNIGILSLTVVRTHTCKSANLYTHIHKSNSILFVECQKLIYDFWFNILYPNIEEIRVSAGKGGAVYWCQLVEIVWACFIEIYDYNFKLKMSNNTKIDNIKRTKYLMKCFNDVREICNTFRDDFAIFTYKVLLSILLKFYRKWFYLRGMYKKKTCKCFKF